MGVGSEDVAIESRNGSEPATVREARAVYFAENGFPPDGGYAKRWVIFAVGPLPFAFPNTEGRRRAVPYHDLHHVATGYATDLAGEGEIGAWELATGCGHHPAAWVLNLLAMYGALFVSPRRVFRAFVRGRHCRNLYGEELGADLLEETVPALRSRLALDRAPPAPRAGDAAAFAPLVLAALLAGVGPAALLLALVLWIAG